MMLHDAAEPLAISSCRRYARDPCPPMSEPATTSRASLPRIMGLPRWLAFSLLTILLWGVWGAVSKVASDGVDANTNQIFFTFGLLPLILIV